MALFHINWRVRILLRVSNHYKNNISRRRKSSASTSSRRFEADSSYRKMISRKHFHMRLLVVIYEITQIAHVTLAKIPATSGNSPFGYFPALPIGKATFIALRRSIMGISYPYGRYDTRFRKRLQRPSVRNHGFAILRR